MIDLDQLVEVIQKSANSAATAIAQKNEEFLSEYFYTVNQESLSKHVIKDLPTEMTNGKVLRPKVVAIDYPSSEKDESHTVLVPLITLAPISQLQISELNVDLDLLITEVDGKANIQFPRSKEGKHSFCSKDRSTPNAKVSIKIDNFNTPPGVEMVVEGFDKALRAQIPS